MDFDQLEYFRTTAAYGSISRAAQAMHITQPALSRSIARLEDEVGVPLFDRDRHHIVLNEYGKVFLAEIEHAFIHVNSALSCVRQMYMAKQNILSIAYSNGEIILPVISKFIVDNPELSIREHRFPQQEIEKYLISQKFELGFFTTAPKVSDLLALEAICPIPLSFLYDESLDAICPAAASDILRTMPILCYTAGISMEYLITQCRANGIAPAVIGEVDSLDLLRTLLLEGKGIAIVPTATAQALTKQTPFRHIPVHADFLNISLYAAWLAGHSLTDRSFAFIELVKKTLNI